MADAYDVWARVVCWWFWRLRERKASALARDLLVELASYAGKPKGDHPGEAWPSMEQLQETLPVSKRSILKALKELCDAGIVEVHRRNRRLRETNLYRLAIGGEPFQVKDVVHVDKSVDKSKSGEQHSSPKNQRLGELRRARLGEEVGSGLSSQPVLKAASNRPIEPTIEPAVLNVPADALSRAASENVHKNGNGTAPRFRRLSDVYETSMAKKATA